MADTTLICTFYSFEPIIASTTAYSPKKIILLVATNSLKDPKVTANISRAEGVYKGIVPVSVVKVDESDMLAVAKETVRLIEAEAASNRVVVNISGGWKLLAQGALCGCYARPDKVDKIICNDLSEPNKIVELPKLTFGLSATKRELLEAIARRDGKPISDIAKKLDKTAGMVYQHLKELKELGYVDEKFEVTLAGKLALV